MDPRALEELASIYRTRGLNEMLKSKPKICSRYGLSQVPRNTQIARYAPGLIKKPVRSSSGIVVISVMSSPASCPHGKCIYCPGGPDSKFNSPQSYTGQEPAGLRARQFNYDPYLQVAHRLDQLDQMGHRIQKLELIVMGGTFTARDPKYQIWFIKRCYDALNRMDSADLESALKLNESAPHRCIGLTIETRPDWCSIPQLELMLSYGTTKVELGVQHLDEQVLNLIQRGHGIREVIQANKLLRDSALKVGFHLMLGLPGSDLDCDLEMFKKLFQDPDFKPDYLKIYPTLVVEGTKLHQLWARGEYAALDDQTAAQLIAQIKKLVPPWVRIQRIQRDIPAKLISVGVRKSNIRQLAKSIFPGCRCIRCREVGKRWLEGIRPDPSKIQFRQLDYWACDGQEFFLSFEDPLSDSLIGFLRLRFPAEPYRSELRSAALIRELHIYGIPAQLGSLPQEQGSFQHLGYGSLLVAKAEQMASENGYLKIATMSGVGARGYYRKLGYIQQGPFMVKYLGGSTGSRMI